jgi:uncharacterized protein (TIGR03000 family)
MNPKRLNAVPRALTAALLLAAWSAVTLAPRTLAQTPAASSPGPATAQITVVVPADAEVFFDGDPTQQRGTERYFVSPPLEIGRTYRYVILARWAQGGKTIEQTRKVPVTGGATVRVDFLRPAPADAGGLTGQNVGAGEDKEVVSSTALRLTPASSINFRKQLGLPYRTLGTLGARIDAARRANDPVTLANAASELAVAESVSGKRASLTSKALASEAAKLAALRRQVLELRAVLRVNQQVTDEQDDVTLLKQSIALARQQAQEDQEAINRNLEPTWTPRTVVVNNYTTQYVDINVNGNYKGQVAPGMTQTFTIEHRWNPTVLTAYGDEDSVTWGPRYIWGRFNKYTWNIN